MVGFRSARSRGCEKQAGQGRRVKPMLVRIGEPEDADPAQLRSASRVCADLGSAISIRLPMGYVAPWRFPGLWSGLGGASLGALAAAAALLAVALDLARELLRTEVDRVLQIGRGFTRAQRRTLQVERRLGDLVLRDGRVLLDQELQVELRKVRDLLGHAAKAVLDMGSD